jgi:hypothetical protein
MNVKIGTLGKLVKKGVESRWTGFDSCIVRMGCAGLGGRLRAGGCDEHGK